MRELLTIHIENSNFLIKVLELIRENKDPILEFGYKVLNFCLFIKCGSIDINHKVMFNRPFTSPKVNYSDFYIVIVQDVDGEHKKEHNKVLSVATFKMIKHELDELLVVAIELKSRKWEIPKKMMSTLKKLTCDLGSKQMVLSSTQNAKKFWIEKCGFSVMRVGMEERFNFLKFEECIILEKILLKKKF